MRVLALSIAKHKLDPFKRPVHIVRHLVRANKTHGQSCWPGIGELRTTAFRTGLCGRGTPMGPEREAVFDGVSVTYRNGHR
jgi:hypothetical protein